MKAVTQWFQGHVKPAHIGWYERRYFHGIDFGMFDYWDGKLWRLTKGGCNAFVQNRQWRGLANREAA
jgi:hypothetical protein